MKLSTREMVRVALFTGLTCIVALILKWGGEILVPFSFLPMMAMLAGALLGSRLGAMSMVVYVVMGLVGIPVFAKPPYGGLAYVLQPTFGFILGFIAAAVVVGKILQGNTRFSVVRYAVAMVAGITIIYLFGLPYMYAILNFYLGKSISMMRVIQVGFLPFIGLDLVKGVIAAGIAKVVKERVAFLAERAA